MTSKMSLEEKELMAAAGVTAPDPGEWSADFESHYIEGWLPGNVHLKVDLISQIEENLWVGGFLPGVTLPEDFRYVVSLYRWGQYDLPKWCTRTEVEMFDSKDEPDEHLLEGLGSLVAHLMDSGPTLVHCQAGINRSNLVAAMALRARGRTSEEAIALLREKRSPLVLSNQTFENFLWRLDAG